jgi:hypothetical protein
LWHTTTLAKELSVEGHEDDLYEAADWQARQKGSRRSWRRAT